MKSKLLKFILINFSLLAFLNLPLVLNIAGNQILAQEIFSFPDETKGTGTYFEIKNSEYLNITLKSTEEITLVLESIPRMISLDISSSTDSTSANLTISGLEPKKTYYKYQDSYKQGVVFVSDENGTSIWQQDLSQPHHIWFQEEKGAIFLPDDCSSYGVWDGENRICTLTQNVTSSIEIATSSITLDCNNFSISGSGSSYGIYISNKMNVTIKNCRNINNFSTGIFLRWFSTNNTLINNNVKENEIGIELLFYSSQNQVIDNVILNNYLVGLEIEAASDNNSLLNNIISNNDLGIFIGESANNILKNNTLFSNKYNFDVVGSTLSHFIHQIGTDNTIEGKPIYYVVNQQNLQLSNEAGFIGIVNSQNITIRDLILEKNGTGLLVAYSKNLTIENINILDNAFGILLYYSTDNVLTHNNISQNNLGIYFSYSNNNTLTDNNLSQNGVEGGALLLVFSNDNKIYHNNFINNNKQARVYYGSGNLFDDSYPSGGNYWSDYDTPEEGCADTNNDGFCDSPYTFYGGQDRYPFIRESGWIINQPPIISDLGQFKSDGTISIIEGDITTESTVVFKAQLNDPDNDQVKFEIELRQFQEPFTGIYDGGVLSSDFVDSGSEATITREGLVNGQYKWRARAVDDKGNKSDWQEFEETGNVDFEVKLVPLYTQIESPYPSEAETRVWSRLVYGTSDYKECFDDELNYSAIRNCGCAITSQVMILRFHGVTTTIDGSDVNPATLNEWLTNNNGYWKDGGVKFAKIQEYSKDESGFARVIYDGSTAFKDNSTLDLYLDSSKPIILYEKVLVQEESTSHFIVADDRLSTTYTVKDPSWYETKYLIQAKGPHIQNYNNNFYGLRLFSPALALHGVDSISLNLTSPAELLVTDPQGRKLGKDPINNIEYNEIPAASYYQEGIGNPFTETPTTTKESKFIWISKPMSGKYDIQVIGTDTGGYTLAMSAYDQNGQSKDTTQSGSTTINNIQKFELNYSTSSIQQTEFYRIVNIDIKPGSEPNSINLKSKGVTPVAILTDGFFDAKNAVIDTVLFAGAKPVKSGFEDIDNDGDLDLILHFKTQSLQLNPTDTEAVLTGKLNDDTLIKGVDSIRIVGK